MAARKKAPAKKQAPQAPSSKQLPEGYRQLNAGFAPTWEPEEGDIVEGQVTAIRQVEMRRGRKVIETRAMEVEQEDGERVTIWEAALLSELFDTAEVGSQVFVMYQGLGNAKPGQNPPKMFLSGIAGDEAPF